MRIRCRVVNQRDPDIDGATLTHVDLDLPPMFGGARVLSLASVEATYDQWSPQSHVGIPNDLHCSQLGHDFRRGSGVAESSPFLSKLTAVAGGHRVGRGQNGQPAGVSVDGLLRHLRVRSTSMWAALRSSCDVPNPRIRIRDGSAAHPGRLQQALGATYQAIGGGASSLCALPHRNWFCTATLPLNNGAGNTARFPRVFAAVVSPSRAVLYISACQCGDRSSYTGVACGDTRGPSTGWTALMSCRPVLRAAVAFLDAEPLPPAQVLVTVRSPNVVTVYVLSSSTTPEGERDTSGTPPTSPVRKVLDTCLPGLDRASADLQMSVASLVRLQSGAAPEAAASSLGVQFGWTSTQPWPQQMLTVLFLQGNGSNMSRHSALLWIVEAPTRLLTDSSAADSADEDEDDDAPIVPCGPWVVLDVPTTAPLHLIASYAAYDADGLVHLVLAFTVAGSPDVEAGSSVDVVLFVPVLDVWTSPTPVKFSGDENDRQASLRALQACIRAEVGKVLSASSVE